MGPKLVLEVDEVDDDDDVDDVVDVDDVDDVDEVLEVLVVLVVRSATAHKLRSATAVTPASCDSDAGLVSTTTFSLLLSVSHSKASRRAAVVTPTANTSTPLLKMTVPPRLLNWF